MLEATNGTDTTDCRSDGHSMPVLYHLEIGTFSIGGHRLTMYINAATVLAHISTTTTTTTTENPEKRSSTF